MKERPILFSGPMVRAILSGRKTQTRRVVKPQINVPRAPYGCIGGQGFGFIFGGQVVKCPYGELGDRLWVRETTCIAPKRFATPDDTCKTDYDGDKRFVSYKADGHSEDAMRDYKLKWTPSIHVPRWASRLTLEIVSVRVERLHEISEGDAVAEGIEPVQMPTDEVMYEDYVQGGALVARPVSCYATLWDKINGAGAFSTNPWVWVVEFKRI